MTSSLKSVVFFLAWLLATNRMAAQTTTYPTYHFARKIPLSGDGRWDLMKTYGEKERIYITHQDRIHVIDARQEVDTLLTDIRGFGHAYGIGLAKEFNAGYVTDRDKNEVVIFNDSTFQITRRIPIPGKQPEAVWYDKFSKQIFVFCAGSKNALVFQAKNGQLIADIPLQGTPEFGCVDDLGLFYVTLVDTHEVIAIDVLKHTIRNRFALDKNKAPTGITIDVRTNRIFTVCRDAKTLLAMDATTGAIVNTIPIGAGADGVIYEKILKVLITANGDGTATIIYQKSADEYEVVQTMKTQPGLRTIIHRQISHHAYLSGAEYEADGKTIKPNTFGVFVFSPSTQ